MHARARRDLPFWPALLDEELGAAYLSVGRSTFQGVVARAKINPVDMGAEVVRWRRVDLDRLIDSLPPRGAMVEPQQPVNDPHPASAFDDALAKASRRAGRR